MNVKKILIADDNDSVRYSYKAILSCDEYRLYEAVDGKDVIAKIKVVKPDLLVLDYEMPGYTGLEVYFMIRNYFHLSDLPVIFCTGKIGHTGLLSCVADSRTDLILKPCNLAALADKVKKFLLI